MLPAVSASVQVFIQNTLNAATIYSDDGITTKTNPLTTDAAGKFDFYVANGRYDLTFSGVGLSTFTQKNVDIHDETDVTVPGETPLVGNLIFIGTTKGKNLNNVRFVDGDNSQGWAGTDFGAWVNSAIANLPVSAPTIFDGTHTYPQGTIYLYPPATGGAITISTTISVNSPQVRLIGNGSSSLILNCPASGDCIRWTTNPFNQSPGAEVAGMTLIGNNTAASGLHMGDLMNLKWNDLYIKNFTSTSVQDGTGSVGAVGLWVDNVLGFTERAQYDRVVLDNNTIGLKMTNSSSGCAAFSTSFSYWAGSGWFNMRVNGSQIGFEAGAGTNVGHGIYNIQMNGAQNATKTFFQYDAASAPCGAASWTSTILNFQTEDTQGGGGSLLSIATGAVLGGQCNFVHFNGSPAMTNTITGTLACQYVLGPVQTNGLAAVLDSRNFSGNSEFFTLSSDKTTTDSIFQLARATTSTSGDLWLGAVGTAGDGVSGSNVGDVFIRQNNASGNILLANSNIAVVKVGPTTASLPLAATATPAQQPGAIIPMVASTFQKAEVSTADANVLTFTPPATAGSYRVRFIMSVSAAASSPVLGWTIAWTDSSSTAAAPTNMALFQIGVAAPALTFTAAGASDYYGCADIDVDSSQHGIVVKLTWNSTGTFTAKVTATIERIA